MIIWDQLSDGVVLLTLDDPEQRTNTMNERYLAAMESTLDRLESVRDNVTGVIITSGKDTFLAGADLTLLMADNQRTPASTRAFAITEQVKAQFRRLERFGRPVVAALNGSALGGGLELALACHRRIAVDRPDARFGLPEVTLGLMPGGGGTVRVTRMLGVQDALLHVLAQGQRMRAQRALDIGIIDEIVANDADLISAAVAWILANPDGRQPWDRPGYRMPGGLPTSAALAATLPAFPANLRKQLKGANYPAPRAILCAVVEGAAVDIDTADRIESRWFASLVGTPIQRAMTQAFFFDLNHLNKGGSRPETPPESHPTRIGVIGAGMMGSGIAYSCAAAGLDVVLVDVSQEAAERGKAYSEKVLSRRRSTPDDRAAHLARIHPTSELTAVADCDVIIEAVLEDLALKQRTFATLADIVAPGTILATNTSSLPIGAVAQALPDPTVLLGLHFFSPVDKMPLVEIVRGAATSDATLARGHDLVRLLNKTPIVVNDSRGFFTSRVFGTYVMEGIAMLAEGVPAASIEQAALQAGYPVGPLAVTDEVSLTLGRRVRHEARAAGSSLLVHPGEAVTDTMIDVYGREGKAAGKGFYDYPPGESKRLWPGLAEAFGAVVPPQVTLAELQERLLFAEALEAVRCRDEGVITGAADANIGSIFGIGFPPWTGGVLRFVEQYPGGPSEFAARARELAARHGDRFTPPESLTCVGS